MARKRLNLGQRKNWAGTRCGHLTIIGRGPVNTASADRHSLWVGICDCGNKRLVRSNELIKGQAKTCGDMKCPYRSQAHIVRRTQRGEEVRLSDSEAKEALSLPCRLCGTPPTASSRLGLYNAKLGYVAGNIFPLCPKCAGLQPVKKQVARALSFQDLIAHICRMLNYLRDTGDIKESSESY